MIAILRRDLALALRSGGGFGLGLAFFFVVVVLTPFAVGPDQSKLQIVAVGILWIGALLAALLTLDRVFALDWEDGTLEQLALSGLPLESVVMAKAAVHWITTGAVLTVLAPALGVLLNLAPGGYWPLGLSLLLGTPALSLIGTFGAALTVGIKRGGLLLSLLVLPLYVPTLILGAEAARRGAEGLAYQTPLLLVAALSLGAIAALPFAAAAALKVTLR